MLKIATLPFILMLLSGCLSAPQSTDDPWENWNRGVYGLNKSLDKTIAKPFAVAYKRITPDVVETGFTNFFSNLDDVPTMVNNLLQGKLLNSFSDFGRLAINSSFGIAGFWDPATRIGLEKHNEDFGQTLGSWGVGAGPFVMLPILGPSSLRDAPTALYDPELEWLNHINYIQTSNQIDNVRIRNQTKFIELLNTRADLLRYDDFLNGAKDEYSFVRDAYLQFRAYEVSDGKILTDDDCEDEDDCFF
ncbi:MAG: phospholipid-binding lipoprotein MlaA [Gammaproteobacteria bacterium]|jgi:phospholipid-binding lipoprotein MlaA